MKACFHIKILGCLLILSFILSGCAPAYDLTIYEPVTEETCYDVAYYEVSESDAPTITKLKEALLAHEYILDVAPVGLTQQMHEMIDRYVEYANLEHREFVLYRIRYLSDGYEVMGYVSAPADFMEREYPILIFNRGGHLRWGMIERDTLFPFVLRGYIVLGSQLRGIAGGTGMEQFGGDEIADILKLIDISESFEFAHQGGVYMFGGSRGGMMTYIASRMDDRIRAAVVWAAPSNATDTFNDRDENFQNSIANLIGGTPEELPEEFERRSAIFWAHEIKVPLLIGHGGEADWQVLTHHSINMAAALERYGLPHRLIIYPDADHSPFGTTFFDEMDAWFREHPISE